MIGAHIYDEASQQGAVTDIDGLYALELSLPTTIRVSMLGYEPRTIALSSSRAAEGPLEILLSEESAALDEIVVVGYGTQRRTQLTGSVATIRTQALESNLSPTLDQALGGTVAGLNITATSGQPGAASSVRIRGGNSINASNEPLYVIDGFIYFKNENDSRTGIGAIESSLSPLSTINPSDIERIEVLKDVSATAIYGSRGANGVIIVTTRKGSREQANISYRYSAGFDVAAKELDLMDARTFASVNKQYFNNTLGLTDSEIETLGRGTDWQDAMLRTAAHQTHEFSVNGGSDKGRYAFSASHTDQDGIIINSGFRRYNFHLNFERELLDGLTFVSSITYGESVQNGLTTSEAVNYNSSPFSAGITNSFVYGLMMPPTISIRKADGSFNYTNPYEHDYFSLGSTATNPVSDLTNSVAESTNGYLLGNVALRYRWHDFTLRAAVGLNRERIRQDYFSPAYTSLGLANGGIAGIGHKSHDTWQQEYTADWQHTYGNSDISALVGYTRQDSRTAHFTQIGRHISNETLRQYSITGASTLDTPQGYASESDLNSFIARANYTLHQRYNATATLRADRSSRFSSGNEWGLFPSLGLSWNVSEEPWLREHRILSNLKLRASAGVVGNQEIDDYAFHEQYTAGTYAGSASYALSNLGSDLKWETTASFNAGFDLGLFAQRLTLEADAYYKKTSDLLLVVPQGLGSAVATQIENVGNVVNRGVEFTLSAEILRHKELHWNGSANIAFNHNEVTSAGRANRTTYGAQEQHILLEGHALGTFYGLRFDGLRDGRPTYVDQNNDGAITSSDRVALGSLQPRFTYGFNTTLTWRGADLYLGFQGSQGNELYNSLGRVLENPTESYNLLADANTFRTRPSNYIDSRYIEDASYLKLKNLTVGYTFRFAAGRRDLGLRLFAQAANLLTLTSYSGIDPEVASGTDTGAYPASRSFTFGAGLTF